MSQERPYHHGDLRAALLRAAVEVIGDVGAANMTMREVARRAGVSHTAATYHFGDKRGLLTAVAVEGYRRLAAELRAAREQHGSFLEVGVAYVRFAVSDRPYFEVMFVPGLLRGDDPDLRDAQAASAEELYGTSDATERQTFEGVAAWSLVHGLATLWLNGNLPARLGDDPEELARVVAAHLRVRRR
jgi:AcrR family transcriptional regulator